MKITINAMVEERLELDIPEKYQRYFELWIYKDEEELTDEEADYMYECGSVEGVISEIIGKEVDQVELWAY